MADEILPNAVGLGNYPQRIVDMGDGTWAETVLATVAIGGTQVSASNPLPVILASGAASLADQSVVDAAGVYWLVRDNGATLTYLNWSTGTVGTPAAPVAPAGKLTGEQIISTQYNATTAGIGYAVGDVLAHIVILNIAASPATVVASVWSNLSQGTVLSAMPAAANLAELTASVMVSSLPPLPAGGNAIGSVAVSSLPAIPAGSNAIGSVNLNGTLPAFAATPTINVSALPALSTGSNLIGAVNLDIGGATVSANNPLPVLDAYLAPSATSWTTGTAANTAATFTTNGYDTVIVTLAASATFAGGVVVFEVYDGINWMPIKAANIANYTTTGSTITPIANTTNGYQLPLAGFPQFRVRLSSALTAGTLGVTAIISSAPDVSVVTVGLDPSQPLPAGSNAIGSVSVSSLPAIPAGANTIGSVNLSGTLPAFATTPTVNVGSLPSLPTGANVIGAVNLDIGGAAVSATNPVPVLDAYLAPSATSWTTGTTVNTATTYTTNGYDTVIVTLAANSTFAGGVVMFEVYDGTNWMPIKAANIANYTTTGSTITPIANTTNGYQLPLAGFPQFRVRLSSVLTAGTLGVTAIVSSAPDVSVVTVGLDPSQSLPAGSNLLGSVSVTSLPSIPAGANAIGSITNTAFALNAGTNMIGYTGVGYVAGATNAASSTSIQSPATPVGASIKASAGRVVGIVLQNSASAIRSMKFFNATSVTMGTTAAAFEIDIPAGGTVALTPDGGIGFATGIMWAVTAAKGLTDNTTAGLAASDVSGVVLYA